ncbi:hypothetical protein CSC73_00010 [Pseudoxanthomonas sacheonensis]|nr:hypothetical protein CSC73_00010 [Pseudoxanthomonas sacheonensis]
MHTRIRLTALLLIACGVCACSQKEDQLNVSIQRFANDYLPEHEILKHAKNDSLTDIGGEWVLRLKGSQGVISLTNGSFQRADREDLDYFKERLVRNKLLDNKEGEFVLDRAELRLGEGSSCDSTECSIYVMHNDDNSMVYIGIYKN